MPPLCLQTTVVVMCRRFLLLCTYLSLLVTPLGAAAAATAPTANVTAAATSANA